MWRRATNENLKNKQVKMLIIYRASFGHFRWRWPVVWMEFHARLHHNMRAREKGVEAELWLSHAWTRGHELHWPSIQDRRLQQSALFTWVYVIIIIIIIRFIKSDRNTHWVHRSQFTKIFVHINSHITNVFRIIFAF